MLGGEILPRSARHAQPQVDIAELYIAVTRALGFAVARKEIEAGFACRCKAG